MYWLKAQGARKRVAVEGRRRTAEVGWFLDTGHWFLAGTEAGPTFWSADLRSRAGLCARREVYW